jgi:hypothetical protein
MLLYIIIFITFIVILLINFTIELIKDRNLFKKGVSEDLFLAENFYNKYNKHPVKHHNESLFTYEPLKPLDNIIIDNNTKLFIINSYITLINSVILDNNYLININPLIHRDLLQENIKNKKKKKNSKETMESSDDIIFRDVDWKKIIWNKKPKFIQLERIINHFFFSIDEYFIGLNIDQEYTIDNKKQIICTKLKINLKNLIISEINDTVVNNISGSQQYLKIDTTLENLNIIATLFGIINCLQGNHFNIIMIKNIKSNLYNSLINYYKSKGIIETIKSIEINPLFDNIKRCKIQLIINNNGKSTEVEEYFDFDCPKYAFPELVMVYNQ